MIWVWAASTEEKSAARPCGWKKQSTTESPPPAGRLSGRHSVPKASRSCSSTCAQRASRLSILLTMMRRHSPRSRAKSMRRWVRVSTPLTALTTIATASTASSTESVLPRKSGYPGVSMRLMRVPSVLKLQIAVSSECCRRFSWGSKSETVVPRARLPRLRVAPACSSSVSVIEVLPAPAGPTSAIFLMPEVAFPMAAAPGSYGYSTPALEHHRCLKAYSRGVPAATRRSTMRQNAAERREEVRMPDDRPPEAAPEQRRRSEKIQRQLDEALEDSFPASDPVSIVTSQDEEDWGHEPEDSGEPASPATG